MAVPTSFAESDAVLGKPRDMSDSECSALSIMRSQTESGVPTVTSCWKLTREELEEINRTGRLWLTVAGATMPPVMLDGLKPF